MMNADRKLVQLEDYEPLIGSEAIERIAKKAEPFRGFHIAHVNSTYYGGGVAELLSSLSLLMNSVGVKTGWRAIQGSPDFFSITKKMHNALQGGQINLTERKKQLYEDIIYENVVRNHLDHDMVFIHDPQPLPMVRHYNKRGPWVWRCHLDLSGPDKQVWDYLSQFVERYDAVILSIEEYKQKVRTPQLTFMPAIDPFCIKNKQLSEQEMDERLAHYDIPTDRPLVVQISRFDRWKDPEGVVEAFKIAREQVDARLVLLGNVAVDDPEGVQVYESLLKCRDESIIILSKEDTALVNALQSRAAVVLQKSLREGFGLTVAEAMWKGTPVIGGDVGGIRYQIDDGVNGFLVSSIEQAAARIVQLVRNEKLRREMGEKARQKAQKRFLLSRLLEQYLDLLNSFETVYRLRKD
jgi:trehalose synthase